MEILPNQSKQPIRIIIQQSSRILDGKWFDIKTEFLFMEGFCHSATCALVKMASDLCPGDSSPIPERGRYFTPDGQGEHDLQFRLYNQTLLVSKSMPFFLTRSCSVFHRFWQF